MRPVDTIGQPTCPHPALEALSLNQSVSPDGRRTSTGRTRSSTSSRCSIRPAACSSDDVGLPAAGQGPEGPGRDAAFSYVAPDPCHDGSDTPCRPGAKAGLGQADAFLRQVVPEIERSQAYKQNGLILITFDEAPQSGPHWDTSSCCGQPVFPNLPPPRPARIEHHHASSSSEHRTSTQTATSTETVPSAGSGTDTGSTTTSGTTTKARPRPRAPGRRHRRRLADLAPTTPVGTTPPDTAPSSTAPTTPGTRPRRARSTTTGTCTPAIAGNPPGGGQVGLLMISPYVKPNKVDTIDTLQPLLAAQEHRGAVQAAQHRLRAHGTLAGFSAADVR